MKQPKLIFITILIVLLATSSLYPQKANVEAQHFDKADLSFDFPADWTLIDNSTDDVQRVTIGSKNSVNTISVVVQNGAISSCDFQAASQKIKDDLVQEVANQIHAVVPGQTSPVRTDVGKKNVSGVQLQGRLNGKEVTGEIYSLRLNLHFLSLVYLHADNDTSADSAWATTRQTLALKMGVMVVGTAGSRGNSEHDKTMGVLNGKAIHLAPPAYPPIARQAHAGGSVSVQVVIDESGNVIAAHAISGHPLLQAVSVAAARASTFSPTKLCDEPVRVTGVIVYTFVAR
jgi:TonB family protein